MDMPRHIHIFVSSHVDTYVGDLLYMYTLETAQIPSMGKWLSKLHINTMEHYSVIQKNFNTSWSSDLHIEDKTDK